MHVVLHDKAVYDDVDVVFFVFFQFRGIGQFTHDAVHPRSDITVCQSIGKDFFMQSFFAPNHGGHDLKTRFCRQFHDLFNDMVNGLRFDFPAANGTVRDAHPGI